MLLRDCGNIESSDLLRGRRELCHLLLRVTTLRLNVEMEQMKGLFFSVFFACFFIPKCQKWPHLPEK